MTNLLLPAPMEFPDDPPSEIECPIDYERHKLACYRFSSHSSYDAAKKACETVGGRLADIDPTHGKFVIDKVRSMGGNDFWIGSFINRGRVYRQKGRTSCPVMRGQMINKALYDLVDCNSANRFVCQKYGPDNKGRSIDLRPKVSSVATPTIGTTETVEGDGGMSPVIYVVITVVIVIVAMIALKLLSRKYFRDKKQKKSLQTNKDSSKRKDDHKNVGKGIVFTPRRKGGDSKRTSVDSAVPPSNISLTSEKHLPASVFPNDANGSARMGRPRVNGSRPTRQPPGVSDNCSRDYGGRTDEHTRRRHHSDPRSYNGERRRSRRQYCSENSDSLSSSDTDESSHSGHGYGPQKVYQRQSSRAITARDHYHQEMRRTFYSPPRRARHNDSCEYMDKICKYHEEDKSDDDQSDEDTYYDGRNRFCGAGKHKRLKTVSGKMHQTQPYGLGEMQYFPQPHRLVSWTDVTELNDFSFPCARPFDEPPKSFPREPIRVRRKIHQKRRSLPRMHNDDTDATHVYESLEKGKRHKKIGKTSRNRRKQDERAMKRETIFRASKRSIASIQSRKLPTPPPS